MMLVALGVAQAACARCGWRGARYAVEGARELAWADDVEHDCANPVAPPEQV